MSQALFPTGAPLFTTYKAMLRHISKIYLTAAAAIMLPAVAAAADTVSSDYFAPNSVLSSGHWVKIKVNNTGLQKITARQLADMGFSDPSKVAVCGYGVSELFQEKISASTPDDLKAIPASYSDGDIIFYGEGDVTVSAYINNSTANTWKPLIRRNYQSSYGCYFLTDAVTPAHITEVEAPVNSPQRRQIYSSVSSSHLEREEIIPEVGARAFFHDFMVQPKASFDFNLPAYRKSTDAEIEEHNGATGMNIWVAMAVGATSTANKVQMTYPATQTNRNGNLTFYSIRTNEMIYRDCAHETNPAYVNPEVAPDNIYTVTADLSGITTLCFGAIDYINIMYRRNNDVGASGTHTLFLDKVNTTDVVVLSNVPANAQVWDITNVLSPRRLNLSEPDNYYEQRVSLDGEYDATGLAPTPTLAVFNPDTDCHSVEVIGQVAPQNLHAMSVPRMVIVSASAFVAQAERLAQLHRDIDGIDVAVVTQDDIYNEFSSGIRCPLGIRRFLKMLSLREPGKLKSVLLFGGANIDSRNLRGLVKDMEATCIPLYQNPHLRSSGWLGLSYGTDAPYGFLSEDFTIFGKYSANLGTTTDINVGRAPVEDLEQAGKFVDKCQAYMTSVQPGSFDRALLTADEKTHNNFFEQADETCTKIAGLSPSTELTRVYNGFVHSRYNTFASAIAQGVNYWYYTGHASPGALTGIGYFSNSPRNYPTDKPPFGMWATCRSIYFDHGDCVGRSALLAPEGGLIALVGASREVYKDPNQVIALGVTDAYFSSKPGDTMGDVWRNARNRVCNDALINSPRDSTVLVNTTCYGFFGDPELRLNVPAADVLLTSVNGSTGATASVTPLEMFPVEGIVGKDGTPDETFTGLVTLNFNDAPQTLTEKCWDEGVEYTHTTTFDNDRIHSVQIPVTNGRFSASIMVPTPARPGQQNPVWLTARTTDGLRSANGEYTGLTINNLPEGFDETAYSAPEITALYLNSPSFADGDVVNGSPVLCADFAAATDGNTLTPSSTLLGQSMQIILDDTKTIANAGGMVKFAPDGSASLEYPMSDLADGRHTLELKVRNVAGISTSRSIEFVVVNTPIDATLTAGNPASTSAVISLEHTLDSAPEATIYVTDAAGRTVFSRRGATFPFTWDLNDNLGKPVAQGRYTVKAMLNSGLMYGSATPAEIIVVR